MAPCTTARCRQGTNGFRDYFATSIAAGLGYADSAANDDPDIGTIVSGLQVQLQHSRGPVNPGLFRGGGAGLTGKHAAECQDRQMSGFIGPGLACCHGAGRL